MQSHKTQNTNLLIFYLILLLTFSSFAYGQTSDLLLDSTDIREEYAVHNGISGINLFIRKKPGIESVMLTELTGFHALRATEWNPINGSERRNLSGRSISDIHSQYSIVSSTPIPDHQFGRAFQLFIPINVVYGNPASATGTVYLNISNERNINIRTFNQRFADPNSGMFRNNKYTVGGFSVYEERPIPPPSIAFAPHNHIRTIREELRHVILNPSLISEDNMSDYELRTLLINFFQGIWNGQQNR